MGKKGGIFFLSSVAALAGTGFFISEKLYRMVVVPKTREQGAPDFSEQVTSGRLYVRNHPGHQDVYLESLDLKKLHAIYIEGQPARNAGMAADGHSYVILVHGINDLSEGTGIYAKHYVNRGINVLMPDLRGFGQSEGSYVGYGHDDRLDIIEWIYWILRLDPDARIALHGMSMGAATVLQTAGEHLPACVRTVIADSSYSELKDELAAVYATKEYPVPFELAYMILRAKTKSRAGYDMNDVSPVRAAARSETPILFMHGEDDRLIPVSMASTLYEAAKCKKKLVTFEGADHIRAVVTDPEKYWNEVDTMLGETDLI